MKTKILIAALVLACVGGITAAFVAMHRWEKRCIAAGGEVEQRYEYTQNNTTYTYDAKGNITGVIITPVDIYSYHCWVDKEEIEP